MIYQKQNSMSGYFFECIRYEDFKHPLHLHRHFELIYVREGCITVLIDNRTEDIHAGEFALIPSDRVHAYKTKKHSLVDVSIFSEEHVPFFGRNIHGKIPDKVRFTCDSSTEAFVKERFFVTDHVPDIYCRKGALYAMLGNYQSQVSLVDSNGGDENLLHKIVSYVAENYTEKITLKTMSAALGYTPQYLSRYFHSRIPMTFPQFVNIYRVSTAESLLRNTNLSITEIAYQSGFQSIRNFNRIYLQELGHTPKEDINENNR